MVAHVRRIEGDRSVAGRMGPNPTRLQHPTHVGSNSADSPRWRHGSGHHQPNATSGGPTPPPSRDGTKASSNSAGASRTYWRPLRKSSEARSHHYNSQWILFMHSTTADMLNSRRISRTRRLREDLGHQRCKTRTLEQHSTREWT